MHDQARERERRGGQREELGTLDRVARARARGERREQRAERQRDRRVVGRLGRSLGDRLQVRSTAASGPAAAAWDRASGPAAAGPGWARAASAGWEDGDPYGVPTQAVERLTRPRRPWAPR